MLKQCTCNSFLFVQPAHFSHLPKSMYSPGGCVLRDSTGMTLQSYQQSLQDRTPDYSIHFGLQPAFVKGVHFPRVAKSVLVEKKSSGKGVAG